MSGPGPATCARCAAPLAAADAARGKCPACVFGLGLHEATESVAPLPGGGSPERVGRYRILGLLGEGGMGSVYLAEQSEPVRRRVALKLIKLGMDSRQLVARFEQERQALALMDHPNIARVLDAGATETGRPYFVMELVRGDPITSYCDRNRLSIPERLALFGQVCQAVQHAHQKGIIHRDLKPTNVLVTVADGAAVPKVIDFGIAKATGAALVEMTLHTRLGQFVGTPLYMSPEQVGMSGADVDTRTDIYSLGALLYELLTGTTPFDAERLGQASRGEVERIVREEEPPRPSSRLIALKEAMATTADRRRVGARQLVRQVQGDLDWIVLKCLEKDRTRRYETANGVALEIQRFLRQEPILAGSPGAAYWLRKFVRRHRVGVAAAAAALILLVAGVVGTSVGLLQARAAQRQAQAEAAKARAVSEFLTRTFSAANPAEDGRDVKVADMLDRAAREIEASLADQPQTAAALRVAIGTTYEGLGLFSEAEVLLRAAMDAQRSTLGPDDGETLRTSLQWARVSTRLNSPDRPVDTLREIRSRCATALGAEHPTTLHAGVYVASALKQASLLQEAEAEARAVDEACRRALPEGDDVRLDAQQELASVLWTLGKNEEATALYRSLLELRERFNGRESPRTISAMNDLGTALADGDGLAEATDLFRRVVEISRRVRGESHPDTLESWMNFAAVVHLAGEHSEAERLFREVAEGKTRALGADHPQTLNVLNWLAENLGAQGRHREAEQVLRRTREGWIRAVGERHLDTLMSTNNLALTLEAQGSHAEAELLFRRASDLGLETLGEANPYALSWLHNLAQNLQLQGRLDEAEPIYRRAHTLGEASLPEEHSYRALFRRGLGLCQLARHREDEAEVLLLSAYPALAAATGPTHRFAKSAAEGLARIYRGRGEGAKAAEWEARAADPR